MLREAWRRGVFSLLGWVVLGACLASASDAPEVVVRGVITNQATGDPIAGARVKAGDGVGLTDGSGRFSLAVPAGASSLEISASGFVSVTVRLTPTTPTAALEVALRPTPRFAEDVVVAAPVLRVETPATIPVRPAEVITVAGGGENVFRVLQTLPGVSGTDEFSSRLSVRGGGPDQNLTVMDGVEIHNPFRLYGLSSAFNPETVESFELTAGAFSARFGDRLSSLLVVETRGGSRAQSLAGSSALSLTDSNLIVEGKIPGDSGAWLLTGRRTYYDLVAERFTDEDLPSFGDVQGKVVLAVAPGKTLSFFGLGSREKTDAAFDDATEGIKGAILTTTRNDLFSSSFRGVWGDRLTSRSIFAYYTNDDNIDFGGSFRNETKRSNAAGVEAFSTGQLDVSFASRVRDFSLRQELSFRPSDRHLLHVGYERHALRTRVAFTLKGDRNTTEANGSSLNGGVGLPSVLDSARTDQRSGAWLEDELRLGARLNLSAGLRFDHSGINDRSELSPRLSATLSLGRGTRLRLALGLHTQSPGYEKLVQADYFVDLSGKGPISLGNERSRHALLSLERDLARGLLLRLEGYTKAFDDLLTGRLETPEETAAQVARYDFPAEWQDMIPGEPIVTSFPTSDGRGLAYGFDLYLAKRASSADTRLTGWASYTFGVADRKAYGLTYPFDYDRRHALSVVGTWHLTRKLQLSFTARAASGFPYTRVKGLRVAAIEDTQDADGDGDLTELLPERDAAGRPVWETSFGGLSDLNRSRMPYFARLDTRLTFAPRGANGRLKLYLDVLNLLNRKNAGLMETSLEYDPGSDRPRIVEKPTGSIPFLPSFGIHLRF